MGFDIAAFAAEIASNEYLRTDIFDVTISAGSSSSGGSLPRMIQFRTNQCRTPSGVIEWKEIPRYGFGVDSGQPYNMKMTNCWMSILCDKNGDVYKFFHTWLNLIFNFSPLNSSSGGSTSTVNQSVASYFVNYKSNYAATVIINTYDQTGSPSIKWELNLAYPLEIREIPLDWNQTGLVQLEVIFDYRDYSITTANLGGSTSAPSSLTSPIPRSASTGRIL
jgi:hypothetical protein